MSFTLTIPAPPDLRAAFFFLLAVTFARGFGKQLDQEVQASPWFEGLKDKWILGLNVQSLWKRILDVTHHWWLGLGIVVLFTFYWTQHPFKFEWIWVGWGILYDDLPDIPARIGINFISDFLYGSDRPQSGKHWKRIN